MTDSLDKMSRAARSAAMRGGMAGWGTVGSTDHVRYSEPVSPRSRRRCHCGCGRRATRYGKANGVALVTCCDLAAARWVKTGKVRGRVP